VPRVSHDHAGTWVSVEGLLYLFDYRPPEWAR
jgi:hypothetical protein